VNLCCPLSGHSPCVCSVDVFSFHLPLISIVFFGDVLWRSIFWWCNLSLFSGLTSSSTFCRRLSKPPPSFPPIRIYLFLFRPIVFFGVPHFPEEMSLSPPPFVFRVNSRACIVSIMYWVPKFDVFPFALYLSKHTIVLCILTSVLLGGGTR